METRVAKSIAVPYTAEEMFDLVDAIECYHEFLPWCAGSSAKRSGEHVTGSLDVSFGPFRKSFTTVNLHTRSERIEVKLEKGPLDDLSGTWLFEDAPGGGCTVSIRITFRFSGALHQRIASKVLAAIYGQMLEAFRRRARQVYGRRRASRQGSFQS